MGLFLIAQQIGGYEDRNNVITPYGGDIQCLFLDTQVLAGVFWIAYSHLIITYWRHRARDQEEPMMKKRLVPMIAFLIIASIACICGGSSSSSSSPLSNSSQPKRGWLCDYDGTSSIRLWTAASMQATVKDTVGTCVGCCVDVSMYEQETANGILFYRISVGSQSGWVDVDYFYWNKPDWATN